MWAVRFCPSAPYFEPGTLFRAFSFSAGSARERCSEARPRAALPERLCLSAEGQIFPRTSLPPCARAQELFGDAHTSSSGSAQKSGVAARPNLPSERLPAPDCPPRELRRHGCAALPCAALPCAASRAPSPAAPYAPMAAASAVFLLSPALRAGRAPLRLSATPGGPQPRALPLGPPSTRLLPALSAALFFPASSPFARFPPLSSRPSLFAARLHHAPRPASGALRRPDAERLRRPKPPQPLSGKKEERNDAGCAQKRVSGQVLRTRSETEK